MGLFSCPRPGHRFRMLRYAFQYILPHFHQVIFFELFAHRTVTPLAGCVLHRVGIRRVPYKSLFS